MPKENIAIAIIATVIIFALAFFYYYFAVKTVPAPPETPQASLPAQVGQPEPKKTAPLKQPAKDPEFLTQVITFLPPENLPANIKEGYCAVNSIAQPYRQDAWRCNAGNSIFDPCFSTVLEDLVYCQMNPLEQGKDFLIKLSKPLPAPQVPKNIQDNWAWFLLLDDVSQTFCGPYTGTRPLVEGNVAYYGCKINENKELVVLLGDIKTGEAWIAQKAILSKTGGSWVIKSTEQELIKTVWQ